MSRFREVLTCAGLIAFTVACIGLIGIEGSVRQKLPGILDSVAGAAEHVNTASGAVARAAQDEDLEFSDETTRVKKIITHASDLIAHTDISLNGRPGLIPAASAFVSDQQTQLDQVEQNARDALNGLTQDEAEAQAALRTINAAAQGVSVASNDPAIAQSLTRLNQSLLEAQKALGSLSAIAASGNRDAAMLETRLRQAMKPASIIKSALYHALGIAGPAAQITSALK